MSIFGEVIRVVATAVVTGAKTGAAIAKATGKPVVTGAAKGVGETLKVIAKS
jgi:hypothetical protein